MKCPICHRLFEPSPEEHQRAVKTYGKPDSQGYTYLEIGLPKYCSWECYKNFAGLRFHGNRQKEEEAKLKARWIYHVGDIPPMPGTNEAKKEEAEYRKSMQKSLEENPPRFMNTGFSENISTITSLPSQTFFGSPNSRVLDECSIHLGGEDGDTFNFESE